MPTAAAVAPTVSGSLRSRTRSARRTSSAAQPTAAAAAPRHSVSEILRTSASASALGAGLVNLAVIVDHAQWWAPAGVGIAALALLQLAWSFALLRSDRMVFSHSMLGVTLVGIAGWIVVHAGNLPFAPDTVRGIGPADVAVLALQFAILAILAVLHRGGPARRGERTIGNGRFLLVLFGIVVVVAAIATFGLSGTEAGVYAVPHGHH